MKFKEYLDEAKEDKFINAIKGAVSMAQLRRYKENFYLMDLPDSKKMKIKKHLDKKLKEMGKKKK